MFFRQLFDQESSTYSYLLADQETREAILIDSVFEQHERDLKLIQELNFKLKYCIDTHIHADHITGMKKMKTVTHCQIGMPHDPKVEGADLLLKGGDKLSFGSFQVQILASPGHTSHHLAFLVENKLFTGDALLIRGCGRTDFQSGSSQALYKTITQTFFKLPEETLVYPAHDYHGLTVSTIGEEKRFNPRISHNSLKEFENIMNHLNLEKPKKIEISVPANEKCGLL